REEEVDSGASSVEVLRKAYAGRMKLSGTSREVLLVAAHRDLRQSCYCCLRLLRQGHGGHCVRSARKRRHGALSLRTGASSDLRGLRAPPPRDKPTVEVAVQVASSGSSPASATNASSRLPP